MGGQKRPPEIRLGPKGTEKTPSPFLFFVQMKLLSEGDNRIFFIANKVFKLSLFNSKKTKFHAFFKDFSRSCVSQFGMVNCLLKKLNFVNSLRHGLSSHFNFLYPFSFLSSPFLQPPH